MQPIVLGMGNACLDTTLAVQHMPEAGGKLRLLARETGVGGQIAGALVGCVRLGLAGRFLLRTGDDDAGAQVSSVLAREGLDLRWARAIPGAATATATIIRDRRGERCVIWETPEALAVQAAEISDAMFDGVAVLLLDGRDGPASLAAARLARARGIPVVADFDHVYGHTNELLAWVDHLVSPREFTAGAPHGCNVKTRGPLGAFGYEPDFVDRVDSPAFRVAVVDTTGAGDAFHAGYIYALLLGWPLARRLRFANAAAALACTAYGAVTGLPRLGDVERLLAEQL